MLAGFVGLCGLVALLSAGEGLLDISARDTATGPSAGPPREALGADLRHLNIRQDLLNGGYDLSDPASFVFERNGEQIVGGPVAATEHGHPAFLDDLYTWHAPPRVNDLPGEVRSIPTAFDCTPRAPAPGSRVANVFAGPTLQSVSLFAYRTGDLMSFVQARQNQEAASGGMSGLLNAIATAPVPTRADATPSQSLQFSLMDVVVTETEMPVHLVLQSPHGRVMWNLSLAPGVELSGVTVLGGDISAVSNVPAEVPIDALPAADLSACGVPMAQAPLRSDPIFSEVDAGLTHPDDAEAVLETRAARVAAWEAWFRAQFGTSNRLLRIGYDTASIAALVGPIPQSAEQRVGYHGFRMRPVHITDHDGALVAVPDRAGRALRDVINEISQTANAPLHGQAEGG